MKAELLRRGKLRLALFVGMIWGAAGTAAPASVMMDHCHWSADVLHRDKTGPNSMVANEHGSQDLADWVLASRVFREAEGTGVEPASDIDVTTSGDCGCEFHQGRLAALALHSGHTNGHNPTLIDPDLQQVSAAWDGLPEAIRKAIVALVGVQKTGE